MILLDTDPMTVLEREGPEAVILKARLAKVPPDEVATTIISYEEQTRGWFAYVARQRTESAYIQAYNLLKKHINTYCRVAIIDYDERAVAKFEYLKGLRLRIGTMDLKIASIALANDATLLTRNTRDFAQIPALKIEDWTV